MRAALILLTLLAGCGPGTPARPREPQWHQAESQDANTDPWQKPAPDANEVLAKARELRDEVCKCTDNACVLRVVKERNRWASYMKANYDTSSATGLGPDPEAKAKEVRATSETLTQEFLACARRTLKPDPNAPRPSELFMTDFVSLRDRMCACADRECTKQVFRDLRQLGDDYNYMGELTADEKAKAEAIREEFTKCAAQAGARSARPSPAP
jgi:hypothetical protein